MLIMKEWTKNTLLSVLTDCIQYASHTLQPTITYPTIPLPYTLQSITIYSTIHYHILYNPTPCTIFVAISEGNTGA